MEIGNSDNREIQEIKIEGSHAFIALLKSVIKESAFSMSTDSFVLTMLGMKSTLEKFGYNLEEDWDLFVNGIVSPILEEMKQSQKKNKVEKIN
jgi:hypothetical protein